jgi:putative acetyltransferase
LKIEIDDLTRPQVLALIEEHLGNMHEVTPAEHVFAFDVEKLRAADVTFWTAWDAGELIGCAALKELSPTQGELKSMRTPAHLRRRGAGRALLHHIVTVARGRGYRELFLETGRQDAFAPAHALYLSEGFRNCGPFGSYADTGNSVFMRRSLADR